MKKYCTIVLLTLLSSVQILRSTNLDKIEKAIEAGDVEALKKNLRRMKSVTAKQKKELSLSRRCIGCS